MFRTIRLIALLVTLALAATPLAGLAQEPLTEPYTSSDGLSFSYPAGWVAVDRYGVVMLSNEEGTLEADVIPPGGIGVILVGPQTLRAVLPLEDMGLMDVAVTMAEGFALEGVEPGSLVLVAMTIGDWPAVRLDFGTEEGDGVILAMDHGDGEILVVVGATAPGEMGQFEATVLAIAATVAYAPP